MLYKVDCLHFFLRQEGVAANIYKPKQVEIKCPNGVTRTCRTYQQTAVPDYVRNLKDLPVDRRPSKIYLNVITEGAKESGLPEDYQTFLKDIPHNGYEGEVSIRLDLAKDDE